MKKEIALNTTIAPTAITIALEPVSPLSLDPEVVPVMILGAVSVVPVGTDGVCCGIPGENGLLGEAATALPGSAPARAIRTTASADSRRTTGPYASGFSIAGVSGASL